MVIFCDFIQVDVFTTNHHLNCKLKQVSLMIGAAHAKILPLSDC